MSGEEGGTRQIINRAALKLFAQKGIRETTIRDIASAAGIAEGTMYRHFASKDQLARDLFLENYAALGRSLEAVQAREVALSDKISAMVRHFLNAYETDSDLFTYLFLARHRHMRELTPRIPNPYLVFRRVIRQGIRSGEIPAQDPDVAASMAMGVILQVVDSRLLGDRIKENISALSDTIVGGCLRVLQAAA